MQEILDKLYNAGVLPVIKIDNADDAEALAGALARGGLKCAEVTFRTEAAEQAIKNIAKAYPDFFIAAGTVLTPLQADKAINAGASLIVSPGFNPIVVRHCIDKGYPIIPGICTPSEIEQAMSFGLSVVKFFPAEAAGGAKMLKAMSAPYRNIKFMPTGGINASNLSVYLSMNRVLACGGSWMVPSDLIEAGRFDEIEALTREAVALLKEYR